MRKLLTLLSACLLFFSCEGTKVEEAPSAIPGMGYAVGDLETTPYEFTEGIEIVGTLSGFDNSSLAIKSDANKILLKSNETVSSNYPCYGSGGLWIKILVKLKNTTSEKRTIFFPPGLICKVHDNNYQNAILLQWSWACLKPLEERTIILDMYCINNGKRGSDAYSNFTFLGITTSKEMKKLLDRIGWKKINVEFWVSGLKSAEEFNYSDIANELQEAVWSITNGSGLTKEQISYIDSIPELEQGTYPDVSNNSISKTPLFFPEYFELISE